VTTLYATYLVQLSYSTASVGVPFPFSATNRLPHSKISVSNSFPESELKMKFETDDTQLRATDASSCSLCFTNNFQLYLVMISCTAVTFFVSSALVSNLILKENQTRLQRCLMRMKPNFLWSPGFFRGMLRLFWSPLITTTLSGLLFIRYV